MPAVVAGPWPAEAEPPDGTLVRVGRPWGYYVRDDARAGGGERHWFSDADRRTGVSWHRLAGRSPKVLVQAEPAPSRAAMLAGMTEGLGRYGAHHLIGGLLRLVAGLIEDEVTCDETVRAAVVRCIERARLADAEHPDIEVSP